MLIIQSPSFRESEEIPRKYTCDGENINPPLVIGQVPPLAKSLALVVNDPDAPSGTWTHWLIWNIDPEIKEIRENSVPADGVVGQNSAGQNQYQGACPPSGTHHYYFKIYALDSMLDLPTATQSGELGQVMEDHILDEGVLMGVYSRQL